jgi:hypothetical protein
MLSMTDPKAVFLIMRTDFDSMENHAPWIEKPVGVAHDYALAHTLVAKYTAAREPYKGWGSDELYPKFRVVEVTLLTESHRDHECSQQGHRETCEDQLYTRFYSCLACGRIRYEVKP